MAGEWSQGKILSPEQPAIVCIEAEGGDAAGFIAGAGEENAVAPKDGRRMAAAGQFDFPIDVSAADFGGNGFGVADAAAVRAAKAGPFLRQRMVSKR